jgi:hypothetical protein
MKGGAGGGVSPFQVKVSAGDPTRRKAYPTSSGPRRSIAFPIFWRMTFGKDDESLAERSRMIPAIPHIDAEYRRLAVTQVGGFRGQLLVGKVDCR